MKGRFCKNGFIFCFQAPVFLISISIGVMMLIHSCKPDKKNTTVIASNLVKYVLIDSNGKKWFAGNKGISSFDNKEWVNYTTSSGIPSGVINALETSASEIGYIMWLAAGKNLAKANVQPDMVSVSTIYNHQNQSNLPDDTILSLHRDSANIIWIGTKSGLTGMRDSVHWVSPAGFSYALSHFPVTSISSGAEGWNYFATKGGGIARNKSSLDAVTGASTYERPWAGLPSDTILALYIVTSTGDQWFGTNQGLAFHHGIETKKNWTVYNIANGLISNLVLCIIEDQQGALWIGTNSGVSKFYNSKFTNYTTKDGLADNIVYCMALDSDGSIWFSTANGVSHYNGSWTTFRPD